MENETPRKNLLASYEDALKRTHQDRILSGQSFVKKLFHYARFHPVFVIKKTIQAILSFLGVHPSFRHTLWYGETWLTHHCRADYCVCGFLSDDHEVALTKFLLKNLTKSDIFFDVGANYGFFSLIVAKMFDTKEESHIHAFEPTHQTAALLKKNLFGRGTINECALGSRAGEASFFVFNDISINGSNSLYGTLAQQEMEHDVGKKKGITQTKVSIDTIDNYCQKNNITPTFIKIDVEGAENDVVLGGAQTFLKHHPVIVMEMWPAPNNKNHIAAAQELLSIGYFPYAITQDGEQGEKIDTKNLYALKNIDNIIFAHNS